MAEFISVTNLFFFFLPKNPLKLSHCTLYKDAAFPPTGCTLLETVQEIPDSFPEELIKKKKRRFTGPYLYMVDLYSK